MDELKVHIRHVMCEFKNNENVTKTAKLLVFMANVFLLITKSETGFQHFVLAIHH